MHTQQPQGLSLPQLGCFLIHCSSGMLSEAMISLASFLPMAGSARSGSTLRRPAPARLPPRGTELVEDLQGDLACALQYFRSAVLDVMGGWFHAVVVAQTQQAGRSRHDAR